MSKRSGTSRHPTAKLKGGWSPEEDAELSRLVKHHGVGNWSPIARDLNRKTAKDERSGRIGKQCRERWNHHLLPGLKKGPWEPDEEVLLVTLHKKHGNRWADIAEELEGRSENAIKNHWNATLRKRISPDNPAGALKRYLDSLNLTVTPRKRGSSKRKRGARERDSDDDDEDAIISAPAASSPATPAKTRASGVLSTPKPSFATATVPPPRAPKRASTAAVSLDSSPPKQTAATDTLLSVPFDASAAEGPAADITKLLGDDGADTDPPVVFRRRSGRRAALLSNQRLREMAEAEQRQDEEEAQGRSTSENKSNVETVKATTSVAASPGKPVAVPQVKATAAPPPLPGVEQQPLEVLVRSASLGVCARGPGPRPVAVARSAATAATQTDEMPPASPVADLLEDPSDAGHAAADPDPHHLPAAEVTALAAAENQETLQQVAANTVTATSSNDGGSEVSAVARVHTDAASNMVASPLEGPPREGQPVVVAVVADSVADAVADAVAGDCDNTAPLPLRNSWSTNNVQALDESTVPRGGKPPPAAGDQAVSYDDNEHMDDPMMVFGAYDGVESMADILAPAILDTDATAAAAPIVAPPATQASNTADPSPFATQRSSIEDGDSVLVDSLAQDFLKPNANGNTLLQSEATLRPPAPPAQGTGAAFDTFTAPIGQGPLTHWGATSQPAQGALQSGRAVLSAPNDTDIFDGEMFQFLLGHDPHYHLAEVSEADADAIGGRGQRRLQRSSLTAASDARTVVNVPAGMFGAAFNPAAGAFGDIVGVADSCNSTAGSPTSAMFNGEEVNGAIAGGSLDGVHVQGVQTLLDCEGSGTGGLLHMQPQSAAPFGLKRESSVGGCRMPRFPSSVQPSPHGAAAAGTFQGTPPWGSGPTAPASPPPWYSNPVPIPMAPPGTQLPSFMGPGPLQGGGLPFLPPLSNWQMMTSLPPMPQLFPQQQQSAAQFGASMGLYGLGGSSAMQPTSMALQQPLPVTQPSAYPGLPMSAMPSYPGLSTPTPSLPKDALFNMLETSLLESPEVPGAPSVAVQKAVLPTNPSPPSAIMPNLDFTAASGFLYGAPHNFQYPFWPPYNPYGAVNGMLPYSSTVATPMPQLMVTPAPAYATPTSDPLTANNNMAPVPLPGVFSLTAEADEESPLQHEAIEPACNTYPWEFDLST